MSDTALATTTPQSIALRHELSVEELLGQVTKIQLVMQKAMKENEHFGKIPGTDKPTLLKAGAEKLCLVFRLAPSYAVDTLRDGNDLTITSTCTLTHIPTGMVWGSGMGSCSTRESKYAYRNAKRVCPKCGKDTINRSKYPPREAPRMAPGWYCHTKAGGCGENFLHDSPAIVSQEIGRVENPDKADQYNTVLKMANKRSLVAAVLNVTAASDIFTQDLEDLVAHGAAPSGEIVDAEIVPPPAVAVAPEDEAETVSALLARRAKLPADCRDYVPEDEALLILAPEEDEEAKRAHYIAQIKDLSTKLKLGATEKRELMRDFFGSPSAKLEGKKNIYFLKALYYHLGGRSLAA
ncbi:MAG TPA: hypothetical protein VEA38_08830 [Terriglobales bacterium]|nr:hypothetical protein [Terriglobales bacterium]